MTKQTTEFAVILSVLLQVFPFEQCK